MTQKRVTPAKRKRVVRKTVTKPTPNKFGQWWIKHRLHVIVIGTITIYIVTQYVKIEFLGRGCELLVEPTIELILARFSGLGE